VRVCDDVHVGASLLLHARRVCMYSSGDCLWMKVCACECGHVFHVCVCVYDVCVCVCVCVVCVCVCVCVYVCHGVGAQGPNRHGYCTQPLPSRRQGHERNLPSLAAELQMLPDLRSLVLSATLQVLRGCLPTRSSRALRGFSGQPSGLATRPSAWCLKQRNIRRTGQEYQGLLPGLTSCGVLRSA